MAVVVIVVPSLTAVVEEEEEAKDAFGGDLLTVLGNPAICPSCGINGLLPIGVAFGVEVALALGVAGLEGIWSSTPCDGVPEIRRTNPGGVSPLPPPVDVLLLLLLLSVSLVLLGCCESGCAGEPFAAVVVVEEGKEEVGAAVGEPRSGLLRFAFAGAEASSPSSLPASSISTSSSSSCFRFCPDPPMICASSASSLKVFELDLFLLGSAS